MIKQMLSSFFFIYRACNAIFAKKKKKAISPVKYVTVNFFPKYNTNFVFLLYSM